MRSFTSYLEESYRPEWKDHYLNYVFLKNLLEQFAKRRSHFKEGIDAQLIERLYPEAETNKNYEFTLSISSFNLMNDSDDNHDEILQNSTAKDRIAKIEREEFCFILDQEVRKISALYHRQLEELKSDIKLLENEVDEATAGGNAIEEDGGLLSTFFEKYKSLGREVLELHVFLGANITALRQILIRYDSLIRTLDGPPLGEWYIVTRREIHLDSDFEAILVRHGLLLLTDTFSFGLRRLQSMKQFINDEIGEAISNEIDAYLDHMNTEISEMETVIMRAEGAVDKALRSRLAFTDSIVYTLRYYFLAGTVMNELVMQPSFIRTRGLKLKHEIRFFAKWRSSHSDSIAVEKSTDLRSLLHASLVLNFTSQFLYMMNHYIIEPSSTQYVHALGGNDALSGLLIGMTPWAGLIAAFVYSVWSNKCFRQPIICSGFFLAIGSFLYANALQYQSLTMAMVGRFLTGLGSPCVLNVRFIADTVKKSNRTAISAILGTVSAMGMSLGPFCAVLLDFFDLDVNIPVFGEIIINGMTGPGFLMFTLWTIYLVLCIFYFKESDRVGLYEIAQKSKYSAPALTHARSLDSVDTYDKSYYSGEEHDNIEEEDENESAFSKLRYINEATVVCMGVKFMGRLVLEVMGCSVSLITRHRYFWSVKKIGTLSFVNGLLVIPISTSVGYFSQYYTDITILFWLLSIAMVGLLLMFDVTDFGANPEQEGFNYQHPLAVTQWRYIAGIMLEFCGYQAAQGVILSMLSKVVPLSLARGTLNSGFMATTLASLARANGDILITLMGLVSIRELLNLLVVPCILLTGFSLMISYFHKQKLSV